MFEGNPPRQSDARPLEERDENLLRELSWAELVSRIEASRDVRRSFQHDDAADGSFDAHFARRIAAHHNGKGFFNPDDLGDGKQPAGTGFGATLAPPGVTRK